MDNQYGLKAVEKQNEITEQALEPKRQFETQLDTPLTMGEYNAIVNIYQNSENKEQDLAKFASALEYKRNYGLDIDYAYNNIDALNEARGIPQEYNWSTLQSIKNSFKISALTDQLSDLNSQWMDADFKKNDAERDRLEVLIGEKEAEIEGLRDYLDRGTLVNWLKYAAESSVFTGTTIRDSLTWGAATGLALVGLAAIPAIGAPIVAGMTVSGITWASIATAMGAASKLGGTLSVSDKTRGTMYRELRKQGVEKNLAKSAATINGYVNGLVETSLGVVPEGVSTVLRSVGVERIGAKAMARLAARGVWGRLGKMLAGHVMESNEEGWEEAVQSLVDDMTDAIAITMSEECKANGVTFDKSIRDMITDAAKSYGQGFGAAMVMSAPFTAVNARMDIKEARQLKYEAKHNPSEADFVKHHENDSAFEGLEKKDVKDMLHQMYKAQNEVSVEERIDQTTIDSDIIDENVDIESEEDEEAVASEVPEKDIERMENGRLRTQEEKDYDVDLEGNEKHTLKVGTPNSSTRYGRVEYTVNKDGTIEIDKVSTKAGFQKAVTKDAVLELMRRYAGQDVTWNPTNAYQKKIKSELENENGGKLQRFASEYNQSEEAELGDFLHEKYGQFTPTQGKLLYGLYNNIAQHYGQTVHEMIADAKANNPRAALRFRYMSDAVKEGLIDKKQARRRGLIDYANRVIYVGENGDITTLFHEGFHMLSKVDKEGAQELVKAIAESKDMESYFKSHRAFFVPQLKLTVDEIMQELSNLSEDSSQWTENQDEILTSMFEAYLRDGKTFSKKLENIFSRIADFFVQIYRTLAGGNHLNDNIIKAFDKILEGNPELKQKYEQTEGVRAQNEPTPEERAEADRQYAEIVAKYKGTEAWLKAPNGKPTKLTERQWVQVRTPAFKAWFGDWENDPQNASKVVDENGEPRVVYHGSRTGGGFDVFNNTSFHAKDLETADMFKSDADIIVRINDEKYILDNIYADDFARAITKGDYTITDMLGWGDFKDVIDEMSPKEKENLQTNIFNYLSDTGVNVNEIESIEIENTKIYEDYLNIKNPLVVDFNGEVWGSKRTAEDYIEEAKSNNHDGIIIDNIIEGGLVAETRDGNIPSPTTDFITFSPEQIKSATDNVGTFSHSNLSILYQPAYHGSGASFDKFDTDFMGTGEGAQAFGWGIYLTQSEGIARSYAEQRHSNIVYKGDNFNALWNKEHTPEVRAAYQIIDSMESGKTFQEAKETVLAADKEAIEALREPLEGDTGEIDWDEQIKRYEEDIDALEKLEETDFSQRKRNLYTVSIPDDTGSNYLYWDKNVSDSQLNTIIENLKKDPTADKQLLNLFENAMKKGKKSWVKWREGANVYEHIEEILGSPENASKFLSSLGFVGIDYPANSMSGGNRYGKRNFVIFNADDINIQTHIRYQNRLTEDERSQLVEEARDFDTFDDFLNYLSIMNGWLDPAQYSDALPVLDEIYSEAHGFTREKAKLDIDLSGLTDDEKDRTFEEYIDGDGIKNIMKMLHDMYTTYYGYVYAHGGLEDDEIEDAESLRARIREFEDNASMFIVNLAKSKKELTDKQFNSIRNVIKKNTRMYRELIADTLESETLRSDAEPDIKGTRTEERPTLADRSELEKDAGTSLDDKVEGEIEKKLEALDKELTDDEKAAEALTRELDSLMGELKGELTPEEQKALKELKFLDRLAHRKDEYAKALKKKIDNGEAISQAENTRLETVAKKIKELEQALAKFNDKQKAKSYIDKQNALKELREKIKASQKRRRALKEMHEYKHKLVSYLQRKVPKSVAYEYKGMIEAIISMFSDVSGYDNNITYRGKSLTPKEFREAVDKDGALDELSKYQLKRYEGKSLADYTVEELERFADVKKRLVNVGRQMWQAKVDARNAEAAQIRQIILNHLRKNPKYTTAPLPDTKEDKDQKKSFRKKFSEIFTRTIPMSRITQMLDGGEKGFIYDLLTRDKRLVQDMERLAVRERINRVQELMDKLGVKKEDFYKPVEMSIRQSDDLGPASEIEKYTDTYTLGQLIYGIMAQRNIRNKYAFMFGDLVTQDDKATLNHNNDLIYDLGMKRNERFVKQAEEILKEYPNLMQVADAIVKDWQDINNKTRLNQVMIDEYNQGLDMEDFYMPIKRLDFNGTSLAQSIADDVYNQNAGKGMTTPKKGITYARKDILPDHQKRTNMDFLELWLNSVDEHEHLIATNAYVRKLNRVFKGRGSEDLRSAIENIYGQHITEDIDNYINDFANPPKAAEDRNVSKWIRFMRGRLYEAYLGFKLSSFVLQVITSPAPFLREVNAIQLSDYILKVMANPSKYWKFITERSTMMESRSIDPILAEIKKEKNDFTANQFVRTYHKALAFGTGLLEVADRWMVSAGWLACYEKAMAERQEAINNGDMTQMQAELEASQYADEVVLETQPTGDRSELSPIFKTGSAAWQALTQFTTSLNVIWTNLLYDARTDLQNRNFKRAIMTAFAYALAGTVLYAVQDYEPPEDDENWIKDTILKLIYGMTSQGVSSVPLIGSGLEKLSKQLFTGEKQMMSQRVFPAFETAREAIERMASGKMDARAVRKSIEALGLFLGLPVSGEKELEHIFWDRDGNLRYRGKRLSDNELLDFILKEKWQSVLGRRDNYGNKQHRK